MQKTLLRKELKSKLRALPEKRARSERIWERLCHLDVFRKVRKQSGAVMLYLNLPGEVETTRFLSRINGSFRCCGDDAATCRDFSSSPVIVPCCEGERLTLFRVESSEELCPGTSGILEPKSCVRENAARIVRPGELDLVLVPGLGFDREGNRLGRGGGFYDRFLAEPPFHAVKIALAFDLQILPLRTIPLETHDERVEIIVSESQVVFCRSEEERAATV